MAKLDAAERNAEFGLPGSRKYPMPDKSHAANAKARATQMVSKGKLSSSAAAKIRAKANRILAGASVVLLALCVPHIANAAPNTIQVTIGASATPISATNLYCQSFVVQNNAAHVIRVGDSTTSTTKGTQVTVGSSVSWLPTSPAAAYNLAQWYIAGTQNDVIDVTCDQKNF